MKRHPRASRCLAQARGVPRERVVSARWLGSYLNEWVWKWNHRRDDEAMFRQLLSRAVAQFFLPRTIFLKSASTSRFGSRPVFVPFGKT